MKIIETKAEKGLCVAYRLALRKLKGVDKLNEDWRKELHENDPDFVPF